MLKYAAVNDGSGFFDKNRTLGIFFIKISLENFQFQYFMRSVYFYFLFFALWNRKNMEFLKFSFFFGDSWFVRILLKNILLKKILQKIVDVERIENYTDELN